MADVFLLGGENPVFLKDELDAIVASFPENDRTIYYAEEINVDDFFVDLSTGSLFCNRRMIVVKNADQANSAFEKHIITYLHDPSDSVCLVLEYKKIPTKILNAATSLGNKRAIIHQFKKPWAKDLKIYAQRRLSDHNIQASSSVLDLLVAFSGEDIEELAGMLQKIITYTGSEGKTITEKDLQHILQRAQNASIFDFIDSVFNHDSPKALQCLQDLLYAGESFPAITAMFYRATKIMWAVKISKNGQMPEGFTVSPYEWKKYQALASKNNLKFLSNCFDCIHQLEWESKTQIDFIVQTNLEKFLCDL